jgi:hypothetical protein
LGHKVDNEIDGEAPKENKAIDNAKVHFSRKKEKEA